MNILNIAKGKAIVCISHYNRYEETGGVQDRARSGRPTSITNTSMRNVIRSRILRNPSKSMRKCPPSSVVSSMPTVKGYQKGPRTLFL